MFAKYLRPYHWKLIIMGVVCVCLPLLDSYILTRPFNVNSHTDELQACFLIPILLGCALGPLGFVAWSIELSFKRRERMEMLITIVLSYVLLILVFASLYFSIDCISDYNSATEKTMYYMIAAEKNELPPAYSVDLRAFAGMTGKLWTGIGDDRRQLQEQSRFPKAISIESCLHEGARTQRARDAIHYQTDMVLPVIFDCIHLSVMTMTTVGYGDVSPQGGSIARPITDLQAIASTILLVLALGLLWGGWLTPPLSNQSSKAPVDGPE